VGRVTGVPIEPRAALGAYDAASGRYLLYAGSGGAFRQRRELADVLGLPVDTVSVKAKSPEGLGLLGRREGIAAMAVVAVEVEA